MKPTGDGPALDQGSLETVEYLADGNVPWTSRLPIPLTVTVALMLLVDAFFIPRQLKDGTVRSHQGAAHTPKFFVASTPESRGRRSRVEIRSSEDGRVLSAVNGAKGFVFSNVTAKADSNTYYAASEPASGKPCRSYIHRLEVDSGGRIMRNERLAVGTIPGSASKNGAIAVTSDGSRLAYATGWCPNDTEKYRKELGVIDLETGRRKTWDGEFSALSWPRTGRYLFAVRDLTGEISSELLKIDTEVARGRSQFLEGSPIWTTENENSIFRASVNSDGRRVLIEEMELLPSAADGPGLEPDGVGPLQPSPTPEPESLSVEFLEVDIDTGRLIRRVTSHIAGMEGTLSFWQSDSSGRYMIMDAGVIDLENPQSIRKLSGLSRVERADWG